MVPFFTLLFRLFDKYNIKIYNKFIQCVFFVLIIVVIVFVNKMLGRTKAELRPSEKEIIANIQQDYNKNPNLKVFAHSNENYIAYCYTDVVPPKGLVVCSMFLSAIDDVYYKKLNSLLNDDYDYILLYKPYEDQIFNENWSMSAKIKLMLENDYKVIDEDILCRYYKKHKYDSN